VNVWVGVLVAIAAVVLLWLTYRDRTPELPPPNLEPLPANTAPATTTTTKPASTRGDTTTEDMTDAIEACHYGELKECQ
jgi:hypothetical protein